MKAGHHIPNNLGNNRRHLRIRILIRASQRDKAVTAFQLLRILEGNSELLADLLSNRISRNRNCPLKQLPFIQERKRGTMTADVEDHFTHLLPDHIRPGSIVPCGWRNFDIPDFLASLPDDFDDLFHLFAADIDNHRINFCPILGNSDNLGIPDGLLYRERGILFRFKFDNLMDLRFIIRQSGNLDKPDQGVMRRKRYIHQFGGKRMLGKQIFQCKKHFHRGIRIFQHRRIGITEFRKHEIQQFHRPFLGIGKLGGLQRVCADINT